MRKTIFLCVAALHLFFYVGKGQNLGFLGRGITGKISTGDRLSEIVKSSHESAVLTAYLDALKNPDATLSLSPEVELFKEYIDKKGSKKVEPSLQKYYNNLSTIKKIDLEIKAHDKDIKPATALTGVEILSKQFDAELGSQTLFYLPLGSSVVYREKASGILEKEVKIKKIPLEFIARTALVYDSIKSLIADYVQNSYGAPLTLRHTVTLPINKNRDFNYRQTNVSQPIIDLNVVLDLRLLPIFGTDTSFSFSQLSKAKVAYTLAPSFVYIGDFNDDVTFFLNTTLGLGYFNPAGLLYFDKYKLPGANVSMEIKAGAFSRSNKFSNLGGSFRYDFINKTQNFTINFNPKFDLLPKTKPRQDIN